MTNLKQSKTTINVDDGGKYLLNVYIYEKSLHWQEENSPKVIKCTLKTPCLISGRTSCNGSRLVM